MKKTAYESQGVKIAATRLGGSFGLRVALLILGSIGALCSQAITAGFAAGGRDGGFDLADADQIHTLDPLSVQAVDEVGAGWRPTRSSTATRISVPLEDVPRSVSVITAEVMGDLGETRVDRALDFAGGVTRGNDFGGLSMSAYNVRGFSTGALYRNGFATSRGTNTQPDASTIERIEVLKGPSSGLFGRSDPGGIVNLVTKRPLRETFTRISASAGSWDRYRSTLDLNTPLNARGSLLGRLNLAAEDNRSFRDYNESQRYVVAPTVSWQITDKTLFVFEGQYIRNDNMFDRGTPAIEGKFGQISIKRFYGDPEDKGLQNRNHSLQAMLEHALSDNWKLRLASQYYHGHLDFSTTHIQAYSPNVPPPALVRRSYMERDWKWNNTHLHAEAHGQFVLFGWQHQALIGGEFEDHRTGNKQWTTPQSAAYGIDLWNPTYGKPRPAFTNHTDTATKEENYAFNFQDQIYFTPNLIGQVGVRYDSVKNSSHNRLSNVRTSYERDATVPSAGLLYKVAPQFSIFANASRSFVPNGTDSSGEVYDPETGVGYELGTKLGLFDNRLSATFGVFQITKENVLTPHPDPLISDSIAVGEQRSRGFDLSLTGKVTDRLRLIAAYAYIDAKVTQDTRADYQGNRLAGVPRHNASLFAVYELPRGFEVGAAYSYIDARKASVTSAFELPGYRLIDLFARWRVNERIGVTLNLYNLLDKDYYPRGWSTWAGFPGDPRSFKLTVTDKF